MRYWSSDVCSSDLGRHHRRSQSALHRRCDDRDRCRCGHRRGAGGRVMDVAPDCSVAASSQLKPLFSPFCLGRINLCNRLVVAPMTRVSSTEDGLATPRMAAYYRTFAEGGFGLEIGRAHSELQSLMRISYAVFCLKKKNKCKK